MKNSFRAFVAIGLVILSGTAYSQTTAGRIVTVDLNRVFNEYYKTPIATGRLKETLDTYKKEGDDMVAEYRKEIDELNKLKDDADKPEYTAEVREQKKKAVQEKLAATQKTQNDIAEFQRSREQMYEQQKDRMRTIILNEIKDVVNEQAKTAGYMMVLDKSGTTFNGTPSVIYSRDEMDITDEIIKTLNKNQPKTSETLKSGETAKTNVTPGASETPKPQDKKSGTK